MFSNNAKGETHKQILSPIYDNSERKIEASSISRSIVKSNESLNSPKFPKSSIVLKESSIDSKNDIKEDGFGIQKVSSLSQTDEEFKKTTNKNNNFEKSNENQSNDKFIDNNEFSTWYKDEDF